MSVDIQTPWGPGEKRLCYCDVFDGLPHLVVRSVWFEHRQQQVLVDRAVGPDTIDLVGSQSSNQNIDIQTQDDNSSIVDLGDRSPVFVDVASDEDHSDRSFSLESTPVFEDDIECDNSPLFRDERLSNTPQTQIQRIQNTIRRDPAPIIGMPLVPRYNNDVLSHQPVIHNEYVQDITRQTPDQNEYEQNREEPESEATDQEHPPYVSIIPDSQHSGICHRESPDMTEHTFSDDEEIIPETQLEPEFSDDEATLRHNSLDNAYIMDVCPMDDPGSESSSSDNSSISDTPKFGSGRGSVSIGDSDPDESNDPDDSDDNEDEYFDESEDENPNILAEFPYNAIPNINLSESMLKHIRLMKVRMDGNVAMDIHKRYIKAVQDSMSIPESTVKKELGLLTEIHHVRYDVCRNNCICFAAYPNAKACHICKSDRFDAKGKAYKTFDYIPIIHRLLLMYTDPEYVRTTIAYKSSFVNQGDREFTSDYWDSLIFYTVKSNRNIWTDHRDVGFIFSTDGSSLFKIGQYEIWPLLLINLNLPPADRVIKKNLIICGIIPGPSNPKEISSFLKPLIDDFTQLQTGVKGWDGLCKEEFILRAHIALISGDTMAMAKLMKWTGPNSYHYCRFCAIYGINEGHIYCPLEAPRDRVNIPEQGRSQTDSPSKKRKRRQKTQKKSSHYPERSWDPRMLPVRTDEEMRQNHKTAENNTAWGKLIGTNGDPIFSCLKSIVYPWCFAPDAMHLLDENTPRLYLAHWMGVYRDKEITALSRTQRTEDDGDANHSQAHPEFQDIDQQSQLESQVVLESQSQGGSITKRLQKARRGVSFNNATIDEENESYILPKRIWDKIGAEISDSRVSIPSAFGKAFRDIKYHASYKATELMNFMHLISPIVLNQRLPDPHYKHWHHFVLATEKARRYKVSMADIAEMEEDMIRVVTDYERLYYQYKTAKISSCTTQVHGLLHLSTAMKVPEGFDDTIDKRLFGLAEKNKASYPEYPDYLLMGPKETRRLNQYERANLRDFIATRLGISVRALANEAVPSGTTVIWGRAVAGRVLNNANEYEVVGSKLSNPKAGATSRRNDSWVRYILSDENETDTSYFGRVMYYIQHVITEKTNNKPSQEGLYLPGQNRDDSTDSTGTGSEPYLLAYIERIDTGRVKKMKLAYRIKQRRIRKEYVDLRDVQELIGVIKSRGKEFLVSRSSCFWPKKGFRGRSI